MSTAEQPTPAKRRGRRPGGQDTRAALVAAAREVFSESGYEGATVRAIARRAGVDAAMVNHWFGGKEGLFAQAVLQLPFDPVQLVSELMDGPVDGLGKRIVRRFLTVWDATDGGAFPALVRSIASHDQAALSLKDFLIRHVLDNVVSHVSPDRPELRASLCASQMVGIGMARYVARFEPFSTTDIETLAAAIGPTLQRYLTGEIG
ncbi:TetR/AcrR family transcriptional regulator [Amycolatopsis thermophila]|uniref:AcrR family transcriptional regulator n=1 Tax=Amycolatopsis thermophila TaxID=206084 RepID=A0ABU0EXS2_9PSEU|nr:TetR family transcriptional regulator [Amycolatopsis thermophila]MDQ0379928.1 AcrR family transcriptional regulator [Amycolatopsis thermophila]